ncbi:MAG: methyl-accepting chemotaxis protein, partial [Myxococcota bacterium]
ASVFNYTASWLTILVHAVFVIMASVPTCIIARVFFDRVIGAGQLARDHANELVRIRGLLAGARRISVELAREARTLSASAETISQAAVTEAASVEQSSATLGGLALAARNTSDYATRANELAVSSCALAGSGAEVVRLTRTEMGTLRDASTRVADIAVTMDEISFQTNLLALNAAVEAARAGDHGRGFAVVAQEVRNLAVRSTTSAREIRALIKGSLEQVSRCVELVDRSDETLSRVSASAGEVEKLMNGIAQAIHDESVNISDLSRAADGSTDSVQRTAEQALELTNTVSRLSAMANELGDLIAMTPQASATAALQQAPDPIERTRATAQMNAKAASRPIYAGVVSNAKSPPNNRPARVHLRSRV